MEVAVACCIALLAAACVFGVAGCIDVRALEKRGPRGVAEDAATAALAVSGQAGRLLEAMGVPSDAARSRLVGELRALVGRRLGVLGNADDMTTMGILALGSLMAGVACGVAFWSPLGVFGGAAAPTVALWAHSAARARATESKVAEAMPEAFGSLAISLESGLSLPQAMRYVGSHSEEPVRGEFMRASFSMSCGVSAAEALDDMVGGLDAPELDLVSLALRISQRTGAPLKDLLAEASQLAGERIELARRLDVKTAQARMSAQLVAAMPVAMVAVLSLLSADFRSGLATTTGAISVSIALALNVVAWLIIRKIMRVEL